MFELLTIIGEFLAVDVEYIREVRYSKDNQSELKIITEMGDEILLSLSRTERVN